MEFDNVCLSYGEQVIRTNLNIKIPMEKITGILGPNGCGKTTMLLAAQGLLPVKGSVRVKGREVGSYKRNELARVMGVVPQIHQMSFPYTVLDMVLTGRAAYISYLPKKKDYQVAHESLELAGIQHLSDKVYTRISGGERQMVMVARALCQESEIILFDEPTSFLDLRNQDNILKIIKRLSRERNTTCVFTTHDPNQALNICDQVVLFKTDRVIQGVPEDIITPRTVEEVYGVKAEMVRLNGSSSLVPLYS